MTPDELIKNMSSKIEVIMNTYFPGAKKVGRKWTMGDLDGGKGQSTGVFPIPGGTYLAKDSATGESTNILKLVMRKVGDYQTTQAEIKALLGITDVQTVVPAPKPSKPQVSLAPLTGTEAMEYLTSERGLSQQVLKKYGVRSHTRNSSYNTSFYAFRFLTHDRDYVMLKSVGINKNDKGHKDIWSTAAYSTLFGWPVVNPGDDCITITEGEIDAMSLCDMGADMPVLSVPSGCSNLGWIENDYEALEQFGTIYLCFDNDEAGEKAANEVAKRLGITRCKRLRVPSPHNDVNDLLRSGDGLGSLYNNAESYDPKTLKPVDGMAAELAEEIDRYQQENEHNPFLFPELKYRFRRGELNIVAGYPGHGKSQWLYQSCMHEMIYNNRRACIASFEIPAKSMLFNMLWMSNGHMPRQDSIQSSITQFQDRLWFIEGQEGGVNTWPNLHQDFLYAHRRYGIDLFVIDALMHIAAKDDWGGQERIAKEAAKFAIDNDVTVLLVCHADAKKAGSGQIPELEDILGGQGIGAAAHCVVIIWRNKAKEKAIEAGEDVSDEMADGRMYVPKQRANGITIYRDLWFDKQRRTFSLEPKMQTGEDLPF